MQSREQKLVYLRKTIETLWHGVSDTKEGDYPRIISLYKEVLTLDYHDADAWENAVKLYHELHGGELWGRIKLIKLPDDKDIADLRGEIKDEYYHIIR